MNESEVELGVGETIQVGDIIVTIIDIEGSDIHFRIEPSGVECLQADVEGGELVL